MQTMQIVRALRLAPDIRQYLWAPLLVLAVGLTATGAVAWQMWRMAEAKDVGRFLEYVDQTRKNLDSEIADYAAILRDAGALVAQNARPGANAFRAHMDHLDLGRSTDPGDGSPPAVERHPALLGLVWIRSGSAGPRAAGPTLILPGETRRFVVEYAEPEAWRSQIGADPSIFSRSESLRAMAEARDTGTIVASARLQMLQEFWARTKPGIHLFRPLYRDGQTPDAVRARRQRLTGLVGLTLHTDDLLFAALPATARRELSLEVYEGGQASTAALMFRSDSARLPAAAGATPRLSRILLMQVAERTWTLVFRTRPEFEAASDRRLIPTVVLIGVLISLLLSGANLFQSRARSALNASERRYRQLFEASTDGVLMFDAESGQVTDANPYLVELLGVSREGLIGRALWDIGLFSDEQHGRTAHARLLDADYHRFEQLPVRAPGGQQWFVDVTCNAFRTRDRRVVQCNVRNITDRKQAQDALRESEARYRTLVEVSPQGVWVADDNGRLVYANQHWTDYGGAAADPDTRIDWIARVHPEERECVAGAWRDAARTASVFEAEMRLRRAADGAWRWHLARAVPLQGGQAPAERWLGVFVDIDARKKSEEERDRLLQREQELRTQAEAANRAKDDFLATLSHELRTPLNAILGWTQTLQRGELSDDDLRRALAQIETSANAQARLINDLLNVADIGAGRLRLEIQPVRLVPLVQSVAQSLRPAMEARGIVFETGFSGDDTVAGDPARLQQIVWNLLSNAVKFTPQGGTVRMELRRWPSHVEITVTDSGEGIDGEFLPYVFDRFRQADASIKRRHGGLGLGLAIVRHLAELHGGSVTAHSDGPGHGARFAVQLPLRPAPPADGPAQPVAVTQAAEHPAHPPPRARPGSGSPLGGLRILSVDDDAGTREMLHAALEHLGAQVTSAESARQALEALQSLRPDVLVSDIGLPDEDGYDLIRQVRALPQASGRDTPAVALTGYARAQDQRAVHAAGYQAFAAKPVDLGDLVAIIIRLASGKEDRVPGTGD